MSHGWWMAYGVARFGGMSSVLPSGAQGGNPEEKIPSGTRLRLWSAQRMLSSFHSLSTGGLQGPLRKVFLLLPRVVNRIGLKTGDGSARTPSGRRLVELLFRGRRKGRKRRYWRDGGWEREAHHFVKNWVWSSVVGKVDWSE